MKQFRLIVMAIVLVLLGYKSFKFGYRGLRTNWKGDELSEISIDSLIVSPENKLFQYIKTEKVILYPQKMIYMDNFKHLEYVISAVISRSDFSKLSKGEKIKPNLFINTPWNPPDTLASLIGIVEKFEASDGLEDLEKINNEEILINSEVPSYVIKTEEQPRKWYWNLALCLIPVVFLYAFLMSMRNSLKGKLIGIPKGKI